MRLVVLILFGAMLVSCYGPPRHTERPVSFTPDDNDTILKTDYPNPFSPTTQIVVAIDTCTPVTLEIFNVQGSKCWSISDTLICGVTEFDIYDLVSYVPMPYGYVCKVYPMRHMPTGVYFYRARIGDKSITKKMVLLK